VSSLFPVSTNPENRFLSRNSLNHFS
jgi:hypothetical protein